VVLPHGLQYVREYIGNLYLSQRKCFSFDVEHNMLHFERKSVLVDYQVRGTAALDHKLACAISIKLGHGAKELEKILPVLCIQCRNKTCIYKDKFWKVAIVMKRLELFLPGDGER